MNAPTLNLDAPAVPRDVAQLGQVFTPPAVVAAMLALRQGQGTCLEPACGDGAFLHHLPGAVGIELDARHAPPGAIVGDFFTHAPSARYDSIIGNPPYVRHQDIAPATLQHLPLQRFDRRSNLYLFFIDRCLDLLAPGGELIFITPRDFLKATSARALNHKLFSLGTISHVIELGDKKSFDDALPNCLIWRFERDCFDRRTALIDAGRLGSLDKAFAAAARGEWEARQFVEASGHLAFTREDSGSTLGQLFAVKVGAVSGADALFCSEAHGTLDFVYSETERSGNTRRMIWPGHTPHPALLAHKAALLARRIKSFDESNWWHWGRGFPQTTAPRIYVNHRTRKAEPFFLHRCQQFDGAVLALFPRDPTWPLERLRDALNAVDWAARGFVCDGRFLFTQRSLAHASLPADFLSCLSA